MRTTKHSLKEITALIDDGLAFMGKLVSHDNGVLSFSVDGNEVLERVPLEWVPQYELDTITLDHVYYVVEEFSEIDPRKGYPDFYMLSIYDLAGGVVREYRQKV